MSTSHFGVKEHTLPCSYVREYPGALANSQEDILHLHIKQYTPLDGSYQKPGAVTIIGAHANAFPKELYEPLWDDLFRVLKQRGQAISGIWIADVAHQGMSGVLNEDKLGNDPSWYDHPRDLFLMVNHFRKEMPRPLVGIGHSMGGNHLVNLSYMHPRLLSTLVLIDPVFHQTSSAHPAQDPASSSGAQLSTFRRDRWLSRNEAKAAFLKSHFYQAWEPRVLDLWVKYGLRELPTAIYPHESDSSDNSVDSEAQDVPVTLTTTKHQEVFTFLRPKFENADEHGRNSTTRRSHPDLDLNDQDNFPFYRSECSRTFHNLPALRPSALYIFGGKSNLSRSGWREAKIAQTGTGIGGSGGAKEGRVKRVDLDEKGHLMPMEVPEECASAAGDWIVREMGRWRREEEEWRRRWEEREKLEKCTVSEEWKRNVGGDPRSKSTKL